MPDCRICWDSTSTDDSAASLAYSTNLWLYESVPVGSHWTTNGAGTGSNYITFPADWLYHTIEPAPERMPLVREVVDRAELLLRAHLTPEQCAELDRDQAFTVVVGNRRYRIRRGRTANVDELDHQGLVLARLCCHPQRYLPDPDTMLAQKLHLETDEETFRQLANITLVAA